MKLRKVLLMLDQSFDAKEASKFGYQARSIGHFIGRKVAKLRLETPYAQLAVAAHSGDLQEIEQYFPQSLLIRTKFDILEYRAIDRLDDCKQLNAYFAHLFGQALPTLRSVDAQVANACSGELNAFVQSGYEDTWTHKTLKISKSVSVSLQCRLDCKHFVATLVIANTKNEEAIKESIVFTSKPDELMFNTKLGKLQKVQGRVTLLDKFGVKVGEIDVSPYL